MKGALISYEVDISELFARANRLLQYRAPAEEPSGKPAPTFLQGPSSKPSSG